MIMQSERITLREVRTSDVNDDYYRWMNDREVTQFLESRFFPNSIEGLRKYVESKAFDRDNIFLAIVTKEDDRHIGNIKLGPINWIHRTGDIGILIGEKDCWGKGYAAEAIGLIAEYAFRILNLKKVTASAYDINKGSIKAFVKAGFEIEGERKQQFFCNGKYVNMVLMGLVNSEF
jgi:[ribosomal protein S5]-alanine N-acetyltransferase